MIPLCAFVVTLPLAPSSTLFPYTTLFRSLLTFAVAFVCAFAPSLRVSEIEPAQALKGEERQHRTPARLPLLSFERLGRLDTMRSEEHTSELQSRFDLVCRLLLEKKKEN